MRIKNYLRLATIACVLCFVMTGCGNNNRNNDNNADKNNDNNKTTNDISDNIGNAAEDVADGVGNAVDDLVGGNGFNNYNDAHKYFMDTMGSYHSDAKFELRDENKDLTDYQEGSKGYRFNLYDTSKNEEGEHFGEFYVDASTGKIYHKGENNDFKEYNGMTGTSSTTDINNGTVGNGAGTSKGNGSSTNGAVTGR